MSLHSSIVRFYVRVCECGVSVRYCAKLCFLVVLVECGVSRRVCVRVIGVEYVFMYITVNEYLIIMLAWCCLSLF